VDRQDTCSGSTSDGTQEFSIEIPDKEADAIHSSTSIISVWKDPC
jgi:hypothetical protein